MKKQIFTTYYRAKKHSLEMKGWRIRIIKNKYGEGYLINCNEAFFLRKNGCVN